MTALDGEKNPLLSDSSEAWSELIDAVEPASLLVVIGARMSKALKGRYTEEDILQDVLLYAWRDRRQCEWRGLRSFRSWLLSIIDHRRTQSFGWHESAAAPTYVGIGCPQTAIQAASEH